MCMGARGGVCLHSVPAHFSDAQARELGPSEETEGSLFPVTRGLPAPCITCLKPTSTPKRKIGQYGDKGWRNQPCLSPCGAALRLEGEPGCRRGAPFLAGCPLQGLQACFSWSTLPGALPACSVPASVLLDHEPLGDGNCISVILASLSACSWC